MNKYLSNYVAFIDYCMYDFLGGPKIIQIRLIVNFFKALTLPYILFLMYYFQNFSLGAYLYLALHGSYGIIWLVKDFTFPDVNFQKYTTIPSAIGGSGVLFAYWIISFLQIAGYGVNSPKPQSVCIIISIYVFGLLIMMASDCQKYYILKEKKGLINNGMFKFNRNPNYTGEILIYLSFALLTNNALSYLIVLSSWIFMFVPFMLRKEQSLKQKEGWKLYHKQTYLCFWRIFECSILNWAVYVVFFICILNIIIN